MVQKSLFFVWCKILWHIAVWFELNCFGIVCYRCLYHVACLLIVKDFTQVVAIKLILLKLCNLRE